MRGSEKQIKWAMEIKEELMFELERMLKIANSFLQDEEDEEILAVGKKYIDIIEDIMSKASKEEEAKFFIDRRFGMNQFFEAYGYEVDDTLRNLAVSEEGRILKSTSLMANF